MNTSKLILSFSCGKVNFSRSILLLKTGFYMSKEMEVACLLWLSDDKSFPETFWVVCQMTNRPQRRFESFVRWQIARRDVLSHLSDDKSFPETFWAICQMTNRSQRRFGASVSSTLRKMTIWEHLHSGVLLERVFLWIATLTLAMTGVRSLDCHASLAMTGMRSLDCHADARNDRFGTWVYKSFFPCLRIKDCICGAKRYG